MPQQTSPYIEGKYGWNYGESGWNSGMDENLLKFSYMFDRNIDGVVGSLPSPVNGTAYFLTTDNRLYFGIGTAWYSTPTPKWFTLILKSTGVTYQFNGTSISVVPNNSVLDTSISNLELTISNLGTASSKPIEYFASAAQLDVASAQANAYTDTQLAPVSTQLASLTTTVGGKQPLDATLTALAGVTTAANTLIYATGVDAFTTTSITTFGRSVVGTADAAALRTVLGTTSFVQGSAQNSTTGTSVDFNSLPTGIKRLTAVFVNVSTTGTSTIQFQLGGGSLQVSGYTGRSSAVTTGGTVQSNGSTSGFLTTTATAAAISLSGTIVFNNLSGNVWQAMGTAYDSSNSVLNFAGTVTLGGALDRLRMTTIAGLDSFDLGSINILYEG